MGNPLRDLYSLFFPSCCCVCGRRLPDGGDFLCSDCRWDIPLTGYWAEFDNPVAKKFHKHIPVIHASAFFFYVHESGYRDMVHSFKYAGRWAIAEKAGYWYGAELRQSGVCGFDLVVPVPLHFRRRMWRGYNQSEYIAKGLASALGLSVDARCVKRKKYNRSQTSRSADQRWDNVRGIFDVRHAERLAGKHILLVDDVLTTGATIISCAQAILKEVPDCKISIAVLATKRE